MYMYVVYASNVGFSQRIAPYICIKHLLNSCFSDQGQIA